MYKSYKFWLYLDENQKILINKNTGCARLIYNPLLSDREWVCPQCSTALDRGCNAAVKIRDKCVSVHAAS